jgi:hypothetical protein
MAANSPLLFRTASRPMPRFGNGTFGTNNLTAIIAPGLPRAQALEARLIQLVKHPRLKPRLPRPLAPPNLDPDLTHDLIASVGQIAAEVHVSL